MSSRTLRYTVVKECWIFNGAKNKYGYGQIRLTDGERLAHRLMYKRTHDNFKKELYVMHTCDNPPCINPNHLVQGTPQDNMTDKVRKGRWRGRLLIDEYILEDIRSLRDLGWKQQKIADFYGVSNQVISKRLKVWGE